MKYAGFLSFLIFGFLFSANCERAKVERNTAEIETVTRQSENFSQKAETPEEKAVRLAEEFVRQNGYTDAAADENNLSRETVEFYEDPDDLLKQRRNSLEPKAYGISPGARGNKKGWTVVFRYSGRFRDNLEAKDKSTGNLEKGGRAVTMNENFQNLLVEHKDFRLEKIEKKLQ
ncbi:MAG TPA: hypothetical protein VGB68_16675 [Pyrinomonadaceae bacterium]|jgi:hypothetical protein